MFKLHTQLSGCRAVKRLTLVDANIKKNAGLFTDVYQDFSAQVNRKCRQEVKAQLLLLDSTSITLKGRGFYNWTQETKTRFTQGIMIHMMYSQERETPEYLNITSENVNDVNDARHIMLEENTINVFDKGYCDYNWRIYSHFLILVYSFVVLKESFGEKRQVIYVYNEYSYY